MRTFLALAVVGVVAVAGSTTALANHKPGHPKPKAAKAQKKSKARAKQRQGTDKVTICHRTGSTTNPTRTITVSERAVDAHAAHGDDTSGACQNGEPRGATRLTANLTPVTGATGTGSAVVDVRLTRNAALVCYTLNVSGFAANAAHIHTASAQTIGGQAFAAGAIVVPLKTPNGNGLARGCTRVARAIGEAILANPSNFFVNVHSEAFPTGQVQGTLVTS